MTTRWDELVDLAHEALEEGDSTAYLAQLPGFVAEADRLVHVLEVGNASKTTRLRILQSVLIVMACLGTMAMIFLLYRWIIRPVQTLQGGIQRMAARDFSVRVPVNNTDELGVLAQGFNRMADELQSLYEDLSGLTNFSFSALRSTGCCSLSNFKSSDEILVKFSLV